MKEEKTKFGVLCLLNTKQCLGCDIKSWQEYAATHNYFVDQDPIYPKLDEMEAQGLISPVGSCAGLKPEQKTYQITDQGRQEFNHWKDAGHRPGTLFPDEETYAVDR
jgi:DNA-binding PadR family transcriptional regulator